ncbi:deoxyribodipyrimidine photo-lyase, partial [Nocardioides hankookensis]
MVRRYISVVSIRSLTSPFCLIDHGAGRLASMASVMWFRRDLRLADNPALVAAAADGAVLPLFVLDPTLWEAAGPSRRAHL